MREVKLNVYRKEVVVISKDGATIHIEDTDEILFLIDELKSLFMSGNKETSKNE